MKKPKPPPKSNRTSPNRDDAVDRIVKLMLRGEWRGGKTRAEMADEYGVHERTVGDWAMIASGMLVRAGTPIEKLIDEKMAELEGIQRMALERVKVIHSADGETNIVPSPELKEAIAAIRLQMEIRGVLTRHAPKQADKPASGDGVESHYPSKAVSSRHDRCFSRAADMSEIRARVVGKDATNVLSLHCGKCGMLVHREEVVKPGEEARRRTNGLPMGVSSTKRSIWRLAARASRCPRRTSVGVLMNTSRESTASTLRM